MGETRHRRRIVLAQPSTQLDLGHRPAVEEALRGGDAQGELVAGATPDEATSNDPESPAKRQYNGRMMRLRTLGERALEGADFRGPKPLALLAFLTLESPQDRRYLADLF